MFKAVATGCQHIVTLLNGAVSEEDRSVDITTIINILEAELGYTVDGGK
jgi:hypothetical protein